MSSVEIICPGCGLSMPKKQTSICNSYYNVSAECWDVYTEVLAAEYSNAFLFGRVHQRTVDAYAVQHAGGKHPDKSVMVHLIGLHLALSRGFQSFEIPAALQRIASHVQSWPHFEPNVEKITINVFDVALASNAEEHIRIVREWSELIWKAWTPHHAEIAHFVSQNLSQEASTRN